MAYTLSTERAEQAMSIRRAALHGQPPRSLATVASLLSTQRWALAGPVRGSFCAPSFTPLDGNCGVDLPWRPS
jgi:hypothetical protein